MSKLSCHIIQDLLPTYADKLTSEKTNEDIEEHLASCKECSEMYHLMQESENKEQQEQKKQSERDINYLKKINRKTKKGILSVLAAAVILLAIPVMMSCVIGSPDSLVGYQVEVDGNSLNATGILFSSAKAVSKMTATEKDGVVYLKTRSVLCMFHRSCSGQITYQSDEPIQKVVTSDGKILWEEGTAISSYASDIYNARTKYIGDNSAVSSLLSTLDIGKRLHMNFHIALQTSEEPYGLTIYSNEGLTSNTVSEETLQEAMRKYSCVILSCIDNLGYVSFDYISQDGEKKNF